MELTNKSDRALWLVSRLIPPPPNQDQTGTAYLEPRQSVEFKATQDSIIAGVDYWVDLTAFADSTLADTLEQSRVQMRFDERDVGDIEKKLTERREQLEAELGSPDTLTPEKPLQSKAAARLSIAAPNSMKPGDFYWVSGDTLVRVEQELAKPGYGGAALPGVTSGPFGPKEWIALQGASSGLKISEGQPHFRIAWDAEHVVEVRLGVFKLEGDQRRARVNPSKKDFFKERVPLVVREAQAGLYDLTPKKPLGPGEYGIGVPLRYYRRDVGQLFLVMVAAFTIPAPGSDK